MYKPHKLNSPQVASGQNVIITTKESKLEQHYENKVIP